jgi:hypothetical protein
MKTLKICLLILCVSVLSQAATLSTTFVSNNGQSGNMFDVIPVQPITIRSLAINVSAGEHTFFIYGRLGTWVGNSGSSTGWTLLGQASVTSLGAGAPTAIPIELNVSLGAGQRYSFYATDTDETVDYTNGTGVGNIAAQDAFMQILEGAGVAYPFGEIYTPRIPNVSITYDPGAASVPAMSGWGLMFLAAGLCFIVLVMSRRTVICQ